MVQDADLGPIVNVLCEEAEVTEEAGNWASQRSKDQHHWKHMVRARLL